MIDNPTSILTPDNVTKLITKEYLEEVKSRWSKLLYIKDTPPVFNEDYAAVILETIQRLLNEREDQFYIHQGENNKFDPVFFLVPTLRFYLRHNIRIIFDPDWTSEKPQIWNSDDPDMFGININSEMVSVISYNIILEPLRENNKLEACRSTGNDDTLTDIFNKEVDGAIIKMGLITVNNKGIVTWHVERIK